MKQEVGYKRQGEGGGGQRDQKGIEEGVSERKYSI
jgi:hypothetical protein